MQVTFRDRCALRRVVLAVAFEWLDLWFLPTLSPSSVPPFGLFGVDGREMRLIWHYGASTMEGIARHVTGSERFLTIHSRNRASP